MTEKRKGVGVPETVSQSAKNACDNTMQPPTHGVRERRVKPQPQKTKCKKCGLPIDLCVCEEQFTEERRRRMIRPKEWQKVDDFEGRVSALEAHKENLYNWARDNRRRIDDLAERLGRVEQGPSQIHEPALYFKCPKCDKEFNMWLDVRWLKEEGLRVGEPRKPLSKQTCDICREPIEPDDERTTDGSGVFHSQCWREHEPRNKKETEK